MARKRKRLDSQRGRGPDGGPGLVAKVPAFDMPSLGPMAVERTTASIARLLDAAQPSNIEEANAILSGLAGKRPHVPAHTPLEEAQELAYDAWETPSAKRRVALAQQALALSADCADAYIILAEETAQSPEAACELLAQAVAAGERALGPDGFKRYKGAFWGAVETRPYMRARAGLAWSLWLLGKRDEALGHWRELLRLNPGDNQGIRYTLAGRLLSQGRDAELTALLQRYRDDVSAVWTYSQALAIFRREGSSTRALRHLRAAMGSNRFVPEFLLGKRRLPRRLPEYVGLGDESEAVSYTAEFADAWQVTPGALAWLATHWDGPRA